MPSKLPLLIAQLLASLLKLVFSVPSSAAHASGDAEQALLLLIAHLFASLAQAGLQ